MNIYTSIIIICWVVFILFWTISSFNTKRNVTQSIWQRFWWIRIVVVAVVLGWLWQTSHLNRATHYIGIFQNTSPNTLLAIIGDLLCILGIVLAIWARIHIGRNWSSMPTIKEGHELVTSGPYRLIRHPIYTGVILAVLGSIFVSLGYLIMFFIACVVFIWRIHIEENLMTKQFPNQYPEYKKHTWALVPWVW